MIRRFAITACVPAVALLAALSAAAPAAAGAGSNCIGNSCTLDLSRYITLSGDSGGRSTRVPISITQQPPCLWNPIGNQVSGSKAIISDNGPTPPTFLQIDQSYKQAQDLLKNPQQGTWYMLPVNPNASQAGQQECLRLPLYAFVPVGQPLPAVPIPPKTLAEYAFNHLTIPSPALQLNPANGGYVNLGTYVWANWPASTHTGRMDAYKITAKAGNTMVTVWAQAGKLQIGSSANGTPAWRGCGPTGSSYPPGHPPANAGPGTTPDCGVLWHAAAAGSTVSATVIWHVTWGIGDLNGPGPRVVPGGATIPLTGHAGPFAVNEIQSVNGN